MVLYSPLHEIPFLTKPIEILGLYLGIIISMQPALVGASAIGIEAATFIGIGGLAVVILLIVIALVFIIGPIYFHGLLFKAVRY